MPDQASYGCFGRFAGDPSESIDFQSSQWTQVRYKKNIIATYAQSNLIPRNYHL